MHRPFATAALAACLCLPHAALAQDNYPSRPITIVVGWTAGGGGDSMTRLLARTTATELKQTVLVENKPGSASLIGSIAVMNSKPDGYTLGLGSASFYLIGPHIQKIPFDPIRDSVQIAGFYTTHFALVVRPDAPWRNYADFRNYAKANPGKISYGTAGTGTMQHIVFERVAKHDGIKWTHIPFKGASDTITALVGGHIDAAIQGPTDVGTFIQGKKLRMLMALNDERWPVAPDVPHIMESGYDFATFNVGSIWGPKGLPDPIRNRLEAAMLRAMKSSEFVSGAQKLQQPLFSLGGREYQRMLEERAEGYRQIVTELGIKE